MQLKRSGIGEAMRPESKKKMEDGVPLIQHPFNKEYDGDKMAATQYLKKSASSDLYFLNKLEVQLQKERLAETQKQTFYVNKPKTVASEDNATQNTHQPKAATEYRYTLKEAYYMLDGRTEHKRLLNKKGQEYEAWVKLISRIYLKAATMN